MLKTWSGSYHEWIHESLWKRARVEARVHRVSTVFAYEKQLYVAHVLEQHTQKITPAATCK